MNNFGVIEVASAKTTHAPGWAYVPDTPTSAIPSQSVSAVHLHVNRKKRAARNAADSSSATVQEGISARHSAKVQKEIEQLQRDNIGGREGQVSVPSGGRDRDGKIRGHTPNVRKILASQKTFANHLDDFEAWSRTQAQVEGPQRSQAQSLESTPAPVGGTATGGGGGGGSGSRRAAGAAQKRAAAAAASAAAASRGKTPAGKKSATPIPAPAPAPAPAPTAPTPDPDVDMTDAPPPPSETTPDQTGAAAHTDPDSRILTPHTRFAPQPCPGDSDPLLESWLPPLPTDEELRELVRAPPLNYNQARGVWTADDKRYPPRQFCEVCGYWGRVRCMKCGTRVCALDCMDVHREECITRYGL